LSVMRIAPDELVSEVKPWNTFVWKDFVEKYIVPLKVLGDITASYFSGDPASEVVKALALAAKNVIEVARKVVGDVKEEFTAPSDPVECVRLLIERAANTFLGVGEGGKYTLFAWTLRKITKEYFEAMYSTLAKDEEKESSIRNSWS